MTTIDIIKECIPQNCGKGINKREINEKDVVDKVKLLNHQIRFS